MLYSGEILLLQLYESQDNIYETTPRINAEPELKKVGTTLKSRFMKRQIAVLLLALTCSVFLYAFTSHQKPVKKKRATAMRWWDFNGSGMVEMGYNMFYTPDPNNWPDCTIQAGNIYCEIYANEDPDSDPEDPKPDLSTITNQRMKLN